MKRGNEGRALASPVTVDRVVTCYTVFDRFFRTIGLLDYTEGIYRHGAATPYEEAKQYQFDYLLDQVECGPGTRVLEIGCGNATLMDQIALRGGTAVGITVTPDQVRVARERGHDARLMDFFDMDPALDGQFDAIVANGPIEHFVQPSQAARGEADAIYTKMFARMHRLIDPSSAVRRMVNTTVHFVNPPSPADLLRHPLLLYPGSDAFHLAVLARSFGGYYPVGDQLQRCAGSTFDLVREQDGTKDYFYTSEEWLRRIRDALASPSALRIWTRALPVALRHPDQFAAMAVCMLVSQSWNWQFRGENPPMRHLRQTWAWKS